MRIGIAGAGAGKTTAMANTIIQFRSEIEDHKKIFCITFTNNAVKCISGKLQEHYGRIPDNIVVSTIGHIIICCLENSMKEFPLQSCQECLHTEMVRLVDWKIKMYCIKRLFQKELSGL